MSALSLVPRAQARIAALAAAGALVAGALVAIAGQEPAHAADSAYSWGNVEIVGGGMSGWGETWALPAAAASLIQTHLAPLVLGQDPQHFRRLWQDMTRVFEARSGVAMMAIAAVDMALHDLAARERDIHSGVVPDSVSATMARTFM